METKVTGLCVYLKSTDCRVLLDRFKPVSRQQQACHVAERSMVSHTSTLSPPQNDNLSFALLTSSFSVHYVYSFQKIIFSEIKTQAHLITNATLCCNRRGFVFRIHILIALVSLTSSRKSLIYTNHLFNSPTPSCERVPVLLPVQCLSC